ncbi:hypothetical protein GM182_04125 [bacterium 3DAC]|jgi:formamidopyrimidine-DNA glycosylase|nr:Fpg/Nei family DNA glycosylase [Dictyoglomota bacterium]UZN23087.1 hypothetical protein GM182_04125 [bacterium 3DAC]
MPEIPEVQVIVDGIKDEVVGKEVGDVTIFDGRRVDEDIDKIVGLTLKDAYRHGKAIILDFDDIKLMFHLRLHGFVRVTDDISSPEKGWIVAFNMGDKYLVLGDTRKLAEAKLVTDEDFKTSPDAVQIDETTFKSIVSSSGAIKSTLMNQEKILGLGNRYVDEILWRSHIHPTKKGKDLTDDEIHKIFVTMKEVLDEAYSQGGDEHYTDIYGNPGKWSASVHGKKVCPVCGTPLKKIKVGGRTSYICPKCQPEP